MDVNKSFFGLKIVLALFFFILTGCVSHTVDKGQVSDEERERRWQLHQKRLGQLQDWQVIGRLNLKVPGRSGSMSLDWRQLGDHYQLFLDGPFGAAIARVSGDRQGVSVMVSDETRYGPSPELLLYSLTGWQFPVSNLKYWVRGLPDPDGDTKIRLNNLGYPEQIDQQGWKVVYQQYGVHDGQRLPERLVVSRDEIRLSLVITGWQF